MQEPLCEKGFLQHYTPHLPTLAEINLGRGTGRRR